MTRLCPTCTSAFDVSALDQFLHDTLGTAHPLPVECVVCHLLAKQRQTHPYASARHRGTPPPNHTRKPPREGSGTHSLTQAQAIAVIAPWSEAHGGRFPTPAELNAAPNLPNASTIRSLFGSARACAARLQQHSPHLGKRENTARLTRDDILAMVRTWLAAHPGQVPQYVDYRDDPALPTPGKVYRTVGSLEHVYRELEQEGIRCLALFRQQVGAKLAKAGAKGRAMQPNQEKYLPWNKARKQEATV